MKRVLVVDDDKQMVRTLCDILRLHGWEAHARYSGEEAVAAVDEMDFSVVLMDVRMEGMNGVEALAQIRRKRPRAKVVLMTAYSSAELLRQAEIEGALHILSKPVQLPVLIELLGKALDGGEPVLVVDDDPVFLKSIVDPLATRGFKVLQATSLDQGLALLGEGRPVAAVLDLRLGELGPVDVVLAIKRASPAVAVILCSGDAHLIDVAKAETPPGSVFGAVRKPFAPDHLIGMLDDIIRPA
jgi:two-component system, NtrC family, response regulator HydG